MINLHFSARITVILGILLHSTAVLRADTSFTTADVLIVREQPSRDSAIVSILPFGSKIQHSSTRTKRDDLEWVFSDTVGGYLATKYLSSSQEPGNKSMRLHIQSTSVDCVNDFGETRGGLELSGGRFDYRIHWAFGQMKLEIHATGVYEAIRGGLRLTFQKRNRTFFDRDKDGRSSPTREAVEDIPAPNQFEIFYVSDLKGFVFRSEHPWNNGLRFPFHVAVMPPGTSTPEGKVDRDACTITITRDCEKDATGKRKWARDTWFSTAGYLCLK